MKNCIHNMPALYSAGIRVRIIALTITLLASASLSAQVVDTIPPEVMMKGDRAITICRGDDYKDEGITITDNYYTDSADFTIEREGDFRDSNTCDEGLHQFRYKVTMLQATQGIPNTALYLCLLKASTRVNIAKVVAKAILMN